MSGPLNGIRVVEFTAIGPVPFCGALLADLGADVVRIDRPPGSGAPLDKPARFDFYNRNKRSVALNLKDANARGTLLKLVAQADMVIEGWRPGVAERLGLGPAECQPLNPKLVYGRMTGWGQVGPLAMEAGHDINYLALTGALHCIGGPGRPPTPPLNLVADLGGGALYLAVGVLSAVLNARATGQGQVVDAAMVDGVVNLMSAFQAYRQQGEWTANRGENIVDGGAPYFGTYETQDGLFVAIGSMEPAFYTNLLAVLGLDTAPLPEQNDRARWPALRDRFAAVFKTRSRAQWEAAFAGREACFAPVLSMDEAWAHPHMVARGSFSNFDGLKHPTPSPRFSRTPGTLRRPAPEPGQHNAEVLKEWIGVAAPPSN